MSSKHPARPIRRAAISAAAAILFATFPCMTMAHEDGPLDKAYSHAWKNAKSVDYVAPSGSELKTMQQLFFRLLKGEAVSKMAAELHALGWTASTETDGDLTWTIVAEADDQRMGRGLYAFSSTGRHALEAPHVPSDKLTGEILLRYAEDGLPRALAWNTVPRKTADLAHLDGSYLVAFSRAFAQAYPSEKILQLHGFETQRRHSSAGAFSSAIVSATHRNPSSQLKSAVKCMQQHIEKSTRLYGVDVGELGGTTNSVANDLRNEGYTGFVHVEMAPKLRKRLAGDRASRQSFLACLGETP